MYFEDDKKKKKGERKKAVVIVATEGEGSTPAHEMSEMAKARRKRRVIDAISNPKPLNYKF